MFKILTNFYNAMGLFFKISSMENVTDTDEICLICLGEVENGKKIECGHIFHTSCLRSWIQANANQYCPKCKAKIEITKKTSEQTMKQCQNEEFYQEQKVINDLYKQVGLQDLCTFEKKNIKEIGSIPYGLPQEAVQMRTHEVNMQKKSERLRKNIMLREYLSLSFMKYPELFYINIQNPQGEESSNSQNSSEKITFLDGSITNETELRRQRILNSLESRFK